LEKEDAHQYPALLFYFSRNCANIAVPRRHDAKVDNLGYNLVMFGPDNARRGGKTNRPVLDRPNRQHDRLSSLGQCATDGQMGYNLHVRGTFPKARH
jgi:hypothetical protein